MTRVIAIDLGAESGRVITVDFNGRRLELEEVHRFPNIPVMAHGTLYWDVLRLWHDITFGIKKAGGDITSLGVDTWAVDFCLLDRHGNLLSNPVHYRDDRSLGMPDWVHARVPLRQIFERTGIQFMRLNTLYQMASLAKQGSVQLQSAAYFLMIPDLFTYWLTGERSTEFTNATTTQFYNPRQDDWDYETLGALGIPTNILPTIVQPGTRVGTYGGIPVLKPATHDTGSAVVAVPTNTADYAYLSSGTWSLLGLEVPKPVISDEAFDANMTNEGGVNGYRLLRNVMGLWLAQECRAEWLAEGMDYSYDQLTMLAAGAEPFRSLIDPDDPSFIPQGNMPERIRAFCVRTHQPVPETVGQIMRTVYESLALKYRHILTKLARISGRRIECLHIIGGGSRNKLLNQMTADATQRMVITGPDEATALGNAILQLIAAGELATISEARGLLGKSFALVEYEPQTSPLAEEAFGRFANLLTTP